MTILQPTFHQIPEIIDICATYRAQHHLPDFDIPIINMEHDLLAAMIYDESPHETSHPIIQNSYRELLRHILAQYHMLTDHGYQFFPTSTRPTAHQHSAALQQHRRLHYVPQQSNTTPRLTRAVDTTGQRLTADNLFWCVHLVFRYGAGYDDSYHSVHSGWLAHRSLLPESAHLALWNMVRGPHAWKYAGPHIRLPDYQGFYILPEAHDPRYHQLSTVRVPYKRVLAPDTFV